jgi:Putative peptidoglycan binding domain
MIQSLSQTEKIVGMVLIVILIMGTLYLGVHLRFLNFDLTPVRPDVVPAGSSALLVRQDASQRAILLIPKGKELQGKELPSFSACSEPPPDTVQNLAQSLNSSLKILGKKENIEASTAAQITNDLKTAAQLLFQRSQGIQLLRDTMFRLCEAFQNDVLSSDDYRTLIQELIKTANFIIPFEQCTGTISGKDNTDPRVLEVLMNGCLHTAMLFNQRLTDPQGAWPGLDPERRLMPPSGRELVFEVQTALSAQGFSPGPVDGIPGRKTLDAVRRYERAMGLPITGSINSALYRALHNQTAAPGGHESARSTASPSASVAPAAAAR